MATYFQAEAYTVREIKTDDATGETTYSRTWIFSTISDACHFAKLMTAGESEQNALIEVKNRKQKREARRMYARGRADAMESIGMKKTKYGWE